MIFCFTAKAENRIKIAVIDTGVYKKMEKLPFMCNEKQVNFTSDVPYDVHGHGSNVAGIIGESLNPKTHCIVSIKFYDEKSSGVGNFVASNRALSYILRDQKIRYVNLSMGGPSSSEFKTLSNQEKSFIKRILIRGITIIAAAGNESSSLDTLKGKYYPASYRDEFKYSNFYVVKSKHSSTNYGSIVTDTFSGINVGPKTLPYVPKMTGSSQATAQKTAQLLKNVVLLYRSKDDRKQTGDRAVRACR